MTASVRRGPPPVTRLRRIRLLVLDVDGVLTDGRLLYGPAEGEWKAFHVHDGLALARAAAAGYPVAVVSSRDAAAVRRRMAELGLRDVYQGVQDKLAVFEELCARHAVRPSEAACMGDD
ncbi:MAG: KdsC family phosphatase, partial [Candidatus Rokuibacteriota bacterium]